MTLLVVRREVSERQHQVGSGVGGTESHHRPEV